MADTHIGWAFAIGQLVALRNAAAHGAFAQGASGSTSEMPLGTD